MKNIMSDDDRENIVKQFAVQTFDCLIIYMFHCGVFRNGIYDPSIFPSY